ncbi:MAG: peptidylprolyl isomerase [Acidobacteriota bacterium]
MCRLRADVILAAAAVFAAGCGVEETVVARVDGVDVEAERVQTYLERVTGSRWAEVDSRAASRIFDQFLEQEAVTEALADRAEGAPTDVVERSTLLLRFVEEVCGPAPTALPAEIAAAVDVRMAEVVPDQVLIRQLLLWGLAEAEEVRTRFDQGEEFVDLSRQYSRAPNAEGGGVIGWVVRGTQPDDIESEIFSLDVGEVSRPVKGPAGYHLFQVLEVRASGHVSEVVASYEVQQEFEHALSREHMSRCIDQAVSQAGIEIFKENLWFEYQGRFAED